MAVIWEIFVFLFVCLFVCFRSFAIYPDNRILIQVVKFISYEQQFIHIVIYYSSFTTGKK